MANLRLNLVVIYTADRARTRAFYELLGLEFAEEQHGRGPPHDAAQLGDVTFEIYPLEPGATPGAVRLGFAVGAVEPLLDAVEEAGARVIVPPQESSWGKRTVVEDWEGRRLELLEAPRRKCC
jgi:catechol 2,3-dioxygenase-like lactoylglutathione lyase family enzyme